eukprot:456348-Amphidinium_carterae.1
MVKHLLSIGVSVQRELAKGRCSPHQASRLRGLEMDLMRERAREAATRQKEEASERGSTDGESAAEKEATESQVDGVPLPEEGLPSSTVQFNEVAEEEAFQVHVI